jgi:hypothetical protein
VLYICVKVLLPASLVALIGNAVWLALVPQPGVPAGLVDIVGLPHDSAALTYWGHLVGVTPTIQLITQLVLMAVGLLVVLGCVLVVLHAFVTREKHPPRSMFTDVMPVGNQVAFTTSRARP